MTNCICFNRNIFTIMVCIMIGATALFMYNNPSFSKIKSPISIDVMNINTSKNLLFKDTFYAFRESLRNFIKVTKNKELNISKNETLEVIKIIEKGI